MGLVSLVINQQFSDMGLGFIPFLKIQKVSVGLFTFFIPCGF